MNTLFKDIRYGVRSLLKHPGFTAIVVVTLAVGIGASSAIFSVVNTVLLRPLPYAQAERIVAIQELNADGKRVQVTPANFLDWRAQNTVFEQLAAILTRPANLALADQAERIDLAMTSANFFSVFGIEPTHGPLLHSRRRTSRSRARRGYQSRALAETFWRRSLAGWQTDHARRRQLHGRRDCARRLSISRQDRCLGAAVQTCADVERTHGSDSGARLWNACCGGAC